MFEKLLSKNPKNPEVIKAGSENSDSLNESDFISRMADKISTADVIENDLYLKHDVKRGLRNANGTGVVVGLTRVGEVCGYQINENKEKIPVDGKLYYRGYDVEDLVTNCIRENRFGFEETTYLLMFGDLPNQRQYQDFNQMLGRKRDLPMGFPRDMILTAPSVNIMNKLARSVLALYSYDPSPEDTSVANVLRQSIDLIGYFPSLIAYGYQAKCAYFDNKSLHLHYPIPELTTAENILRMIRDDGSYTDLEAKLLDICLMLHAEHGGGNNSTFATHLITSSGTDTYSAISAAVGSLKGPKHGGANIAVINMVDDMKKNVKDITNYKEVEKYLVKVLKGEANDGSGLIYGLGHAIYTISDPRARVLKDMAKKLATDKDLLDDYMLCDFIERRGADLYEEVTGNRKPMPANVDLYSGFVYNALNIPSDIATPLFATARLSGWCAHRLEELVSGKRLMRPAYDCVQSHVEYIPMEQRK